MSELTKVCVYTDDDELGSNCEANEYGEYCEYAEADAIVNKYKALIAELEGTIAAHEDMAVVRKAEIGRLREQGRR